MCVDRQAMVQSMRKKAEGYYERGELFCSEAVVHVVNEALGWPFPREITMLASAFPVGLGKAGCLCGAVSGGAMALGMAYGRKHGDSMSDKLFPLAASLHDHIKAVYGSTCCRVLIKGFLLPWRRKAHCVKISGEVAAFVLGQLLQDEAIAARLAELKS